MQRPVSIGKMDLQNEGEADLLMKDESTFNINTDKSELDVRDHGNSTNNDFFTMNPLNTSTSFAPQSILNCTRSISK